MGQCGKVVLIGVVQMVCKITEEDSDSTLKHGE